MKSLYLEPKQNTAIKVTEDTQYVVVFPADNLPTSPVEIEIIFEKSGINAQIIVFYNLLTKSKLEFSTTANHKSANTSCLTKVRGVLGEGASSSYVGKILIRPKAQQTSSFLQDDVLVIGKNIHNQSQPILEIEANDVKASHGATTGRINKDQVYYLMSRGLTAKEAENIILEGFFEVLLDMIEDPKIREKAKNSIKS